MAILIVFLLIAVSYASCIATKITSRIARVVEDMSCHAFLIMAYRAFIPVAILIVFLLVVVGYHSSITAGVADCIACIIEDVRCYIHLFMTY